MRCRVNELVDIKDNTSTFSIHFWYCVIVCIYVEEKGLTIKEFFSIKYSETLVKMQIKSLPKRKMNIVKH